MHRASIIMLGIATAFFTALFLSILVFGLIIAPDSGVKAPTEGQARQATSTDPIRLEIPRLKIDAPVEFVGITLRGTMGAPSKYADVGWYGYGTRPGEIGSAVAAGHLDDGFGLAGVFRNLKEIKIGDEIFVETRAGDRLRFRVTGIEVYPYDEAPTEMIFKRTDKARLNLVTCEGRWSREDDTYADRLVVFTELTN